MAKARLLSVWLPPRLLLGHRYTGGNVNEDAEGCEHGSGTQGARARRRSWLARLGERLLPARCLLCGAGAGAGPIALCPACRSELVGNDPCCLRCAEPLIQTEPLCGRCLRREPPFAATLAGFRYVWPLDGLITRFKFSGDLAAGRTLARLFADRVRELDAERPGALVPVPLHRSRLRRRGYDQALELTRDIGGELAIPVAADLLRRERATAAQSDLDLIARRRNVRAAFSVNPATRTRLALQTPLALVDDVMTTGSTVAECARALRRAGYERITVWAMARAPARLR